MDDISIQKKFRRMVLINSLVMTGIASLLLFSSGNSNTNFLSLVKPLYGQTPVKAVVFVLGNNCPAGFQDAATAGVGEMENNRFPMLVSDPLNNTSGDNQIDNIAGGDAVITVAQMPSHNHSYSSPGGSYRFKGDGGTWGTVPGGGSGTGSAGGGQPYWPRYYKLKPCVWNLN